MLQRVSRASVEVGGQVVGEIGHGLVALVGAGHGDTAADLTYIVDKLVGLRVFGDEAGKMNVSLLECGGAVLWISQFTLYGDARKGRRPGFADAMAPEPARALWAGGVDLLRQRGVAKVATGVFGADMSVALCGDGPVTILLDSARAF